MVGIVFIRCLGLFYVFGNIWVIGYAVFTWLRVFLWFLVLLFWGLGIRCGGTCGWIGEKEVLGLFWSGVGLLEAGRVGECRCVNYVCGFYYSFWRSKECLLSRIYFWLRDCVSYFLLFLVLTLNKTGVLFIKYLILFLVNRKFLININFFYVIEFFYSELILVL